jgi:hypothetical protein
LACCGVGGAEDLESFEESREGDLEGWGCGFFVFFVAVLDGGGGRREVRGVAGKEALGPMGNP